VSRGARLGRGEGAAHALIPLVGVELAHIWPEIKGRLAALVERLFEPVQPPVGMRRHKGCECGLLSGRELLTAVETAHP
jgi:hypothetical protein